jgi:CBS domain-containing protein
MRGITLFIFGGVAHMGREPPTPRAELRIAIAGPVSSFLIGALCYLLAQAMTALGAPVAAGGVLAYLAVVNTILAAFNLLPAFPLDGGRVLRAILWRAKGSLRAASRVAAQVGSAFGTGLIVLGVVAIVGGLFVSGLWWALIGLFLRGAARGSYQQVLVREALEGEPVRRFMHPHPRSVTPTTPIDRLVQDYFYRDYHKLYPVVEDGRLVGCVEIDRVKQMPRGDWQRRTVSDVAVACTPANTIAPDADSTDALRLMQRHNTTRLLVLDGAQLVGTLTLRDLLQFLAAKGELEEN